MRPAAYLATLGAEGYGLMLTVLAFIGYLNFADAGLSWGSMVLIAHAHGQQDREKIAHITCHSAVLAAGSGLAAVLFLAAILGASRLAALPMFARHPEADRPHRRPAAHPHASTGVFYNVQGTAGTYWPAFYQGLGRILGLAGSMLAAWLTRSVEAVMLVQLIVSTLGGSPGRFTSGIGTGGRSARDCGPTGANMPLRCASPERPS